MKNVEGGRDRNTPEVVCVNKWNSVCLNGRAGQGKTFPETSILKISVYLNVVTVHIINNHS